MHSLNKSVKTSEKGLVDGIEGVFGDDGEDDSDYDPTEGMWMCDNGEYIYEWSVNDGYEDCYDGSDEMDMHGVVWWNDHNREEMPNASMWIYIDEEPLSFAEEDEMGNTVYFTCDDGTGPNLLGLGRIIRRRRLFEW